METGGRAAGDAPPAAAADEPRDARVVRELLRSMGVRDGDYESRVVLQFLQLMYRYVVDVLGDAQDYAEHAGKAAIDADDVRLAIQSKVNFSFSQPPPREVLLELVRNRNKTPLPRSITPPGSIPLPPEQHTLINANYQLLTSKKQTSQEMEENIDDGTPNPNSIANPSSSQEPRTSSSQLQQQPALQRVSFPLNSAAEPATGPR